MTSQDKIKYQNLGKTYCSCACPLVLNLLLTQEQLPSSHNFLEEMNRETREVVAGSWTLRRHVSNGLKSLEDGQQTVLQTCSHYVQRKGLAQWQESPPPGPSGEDHTGAASHSVCWVHPLDTAVNAICNRIIPTWLTAKQGNMGSKDLKKPLHHLLFSCKHKIWFQILYKQCSNKQNSSPTHHVPS